MPAFTLPNVYAMSDFMPSGSLTALQNVSNIQAAEAPFNLALKADVTAKQIMIADEDATFSAFGDGRQVLTAPLTLDGITYPTGEKVTIKAVLTDTEGADGYVVSIAQIATAFITQRAMIAAQTHTFRAVDHVENTAVPATQLARFTAGTMIKTDRAERAIETLQVGERVMTRDHGLQTIRWTGTRTVAGRGKMAPVTFDTGTLGCSTPLSVSPNHRMLIAGTMAELVCGDDELLLSAGMLINGRNVRQAECGFVTYVHIMFDYHEIIWANDCPCESCYIGDTAIASLNDDQAVEILAIFPQLRMSTKTASLARAEGQSYEGIVIASRL